MINKNLTIIETTEKDLDNVVSLWNNGDVMHFVGYPNGLGVTVESLREKWLPGINKNNKRRHYSIYHNELGYCGESYYNIENNGKAALDIKLLPKARGKGIAYEGLKYAITKAFELGHAEKVYVDPHKDNVKATALYMKLGFKEYTHPNQEYAEKHYYLELSKSDCTLKI
ncbi:GNAT family N-acetyltransferase [Mycoplasmatota bacterium WC30]